MAETSRPTRARRSYGHYCGLARALDVLGDRWAMLIVRELFVGPRRYTDLHADLPGASTDMLAARLRDLEHGAVIERRPLPAPASGTAYALTDRGRALLPALGALAAWGAEELDAPRETDAVRAHWHALPLRRVLRAAGRTGAVDVVCDHGTFRVPPDDGDPSTAATAPVATLTLAPGTLVALATGAAALPDAIADGRAVWDDAVAVDAGRG